MFKVRFLEFPNSEGINSPGKGVVEVEGETVIFKLKGDLGCLDQTFPLSEVVNVRREGEIFGLQVLREGGEGCISIRFHMDSRGSADVLESILPSRRTDRFGEGNHAEDAFVSSLKSITPTTWITYGLIAANIIVLLAMAVAGANLFSPGIEAMVRWGANFAPATTDGEWYRLFTSMFLHFGLLHIAFNMWALYDSGRLTERLYGNAPFLAIYLVGGLMGSLVSLYWNRLVVSAGASGAVFAVYGALLAYVLLHRKMVPQENLKKIRTSTAVFIMYSLFYGFTHEGIDNAAHIGGLAGGLLMGALLSAPLDAQSRRKVMLRRLPVALAAALVIVPAAAAMAPGPGFTLKQEERFRAELQVFGEDETKANALWQKLLEQSRKKQIDDQELARQIAAGPLVIWTSVHDRLSRVELGPKSPSREMQMDLMRLAELRRNEYSTLVEGLRKQDMAIIQRGLAFHKKAEDQIVALREKNKQIIKAGHNLTK